MTSHIRKGLITGAPAFNGGGLGLSIGTRSEGIRRAITRRAPNGVNSVGSPTSYKIKNDFTKLQYTYNTAPNSSNTRTFVNRINFKTYQDQSSSLPLFETKLKELQMIIYPNDLSGTGILSMTFMPTQSTDLYSALDFYQASTNSYTFKIKDISYVFVESDGVPYAKTLYLKDGVLQDVPLNNSIYPSVYIIFVDMLNLNEINASIKNMFDNKTYTINMLTDNAFEISANGINTTTLIRQ
jgi:hypothetical protein